MKTLLMLITAMLAFAGPPAFAQQYASASTGDRDADPAFTMAELDQMLAPIALYPDDLLSQVLMASTYPLEVVEAARWSRSNPDLKGEQAVAAVADVDWDPSVKGLVAFPDVLQKLDEELDWTRRLGDAFLYQEEELMERVQFLRDRAYEAGNLESTEYARVTREERYIAIEPVRERIVYVPYYDSRHAYGSWWHPSHPPSYWRPPPFYHVGHGGFFWSHGVGLAPGFFYSSLYWPQRHVVILRAPRYCHTWHRRPHRDYYTAGQRWNHDPWHRRGVDYRNPRSRERFERSSASGALPMTATRDVPRRRRSPDRERTTADSGRSSPTLVRSTEPPAMAPNQRSRPPARHVRESGGTRSVGIAESPPVPRSQPRAVPEAGNREAAAAPRASSRRDAAADTRSQDDSNRSTYRGPAATLTRPR